MSLIIYHISLSTGRQNMLTPCAVYTGLYLYAGATFGEKPRCSWRSASSPSRSRHGRRLRCHDHGRSVGIVGVPLTLHFPELLEHLSFAQLSPAYKYSPGYTHNLTTCFAAHSPHVWSFPTKNPRTATPARGQFPLQY